ncbi:uncharacterized protein [Watersipora subatra]|uniref:uncharacterized protein isoform X1 n=1 Tax=Watersipora subatra TaxID=2589382 RepID=UPI00355B09C6
MEDNRDYIRKIRRLRRTPRSNVVTSTSADGEKIFHIEKRHSPYEFSCADNEKRNIGRPTSQAVGSQEPNVVIINIRDSYYCSCYEQVQQVMLSRDVISTGALFMSANI